MLTSALTALALFMAVAHHAPLALQAMPEMPTENEPETETLGVTPTPLPSLPDPVDLTETSDAIIGEAVSNTPITEALPSEPVVNSDVTESADASVVETQAPNQPQALTGDEQITVLNAVSTALSSVRTAKGQFYQINADGSASTGSFALRRPGRVRFEYDEPTPILIVSDGTTVAMEDRDLETVDRIPLASTPLGLLLDDALDFDEDVNVISVFRNDERVSITVQDATGEIQGDLTMVFAEDTYDLLGWLTLDPDFQTTVVELSDVEQNIRLNPRLFRLDEDEEEER